MLEARQPSMSVCSRAAAVGMRSSSTSRSGSTLSAAVFSRSLSKRYTSLNPNSRRHSSRISNSSARPSCPYAPGSAVIACTQGEGERGRWRFRYGR
eukprot:365815-Chlamydomonas_euryale.AAC.3